MKPQRKASVGPFARSLAGAGEESNAALGSWKPSLKDRLGYRKRQNLLPPWLFCLLLVILCGSALCKKFPLKAAVARPPTETENPVAGGKQAVWTSQRDCHVDKALN